VYACVEKGVSLFQVFSTAIAARLQGFSKVGRIGE
jgi:hypothetical protein